MADMDKDTSPLLAEEGVLRQRSGLQHDGKANLPEMPSDWNPNLPYGGRVYLARRKKPDPWWVVGIEVTAILLTVAFALYAYYYFEHLHFHITNGYAQLGFATAQHALGQKYMTGSGVEKDHYKAMGMWKLAADQKHPEAMYNVAVGHMKGIRKDLLKRGEAHHLIAEAAKQGVSKANRVLQEVCSNGGCDK